MHQNLPEIINKICTGEYTSSDLKTFSEMGNRIGTAYLRSRYHAGYLHLKIFPGTGHALEDLASDLLSTLFNRDDNGILIHLNRYFSPLLKEIQSEKDLALYYLKRLIISKIRQSLLEFYRSEDPVGWRILRNLNLAPERNSSIRSFQYCQEHYFYYSDNSLVCSISDLSPELPAADKTQLSHMLYGYLNETRKMPDLLERILRDLRQSENYASAASRSELFHALRHVLGYTCIPTDSEFAFPPSDAKTGQNHILPEDLLPAVCRYTEQSIKNIYLSKDKITPDISSCYIEILTAYFRDLIQDGYTDGLPIYSRRHLNGQGDNPAHLNRLEYMIRRGKEFLRRTLSDSSEFF